MTVSELVASLDEDLPLLRDARSEVLAGGEGLACEAQTSVRELSTLLADGNALSHREAIKDLTIKVQDARRRAVTEAIERLTAELDQTRLTIRTRFAKLNTSVIDEALRQLDQLAPSADQPRSLEDLLPRIELVGPPAATAVGVLEEVQAAGNLARVRVPELVSEPITTEEGLEAALDRIRRAVVADMADGKQVRLQ